MSASLGPGRQSVRQNSILARQIVRSIKKESETVCAEFSGAGRLGR
jgi:hypothetical protein